MFSRLSNSNGASNIILFISICAELDFPLKFIFRDHNVRICLLGE
jgi:hypothetical protein